MHGEIWVVQFLGHSWKIYLVIGGFLSLIDFFGSVAYWCRFLLLFPISWSVSVLIFFSRFCIRMRFNEILNRWKELGVRLSRPCITVLLYRWHAGRDPNHSIARPLYWWGTGEKMHWLGLSRLLIGSFFSIECRLLVLFTTVCL